jgi:tRNA-(ms[2]io[6]A)-hydroxylase
MRDPIALLSDHAHLERKAAGNALDMLNRLPQIRQPSARAKQAQEQWTQTMTAIARDEVEHLAAVTKLIQKRGGKLAREHRNPYAAALRELVRPGASTELVDRLLVSAMIELRSCERFHILAEHCGDPELAKLYRGLFASERGHYTVFLQLANLISKPEIVDARWAEILAAEAQIIQRMPPGSAMHSGVAE